MDYDESERRPGHIYTEEELRTAAVPPHYDGIQHDDRFRTFQLTELETGEEYKKMLDDILKSADPIAKIKFKELEEKLRVAFFRYDLLSTYDSGPLKQVDYDEWEEVKDEFKLDHRRAYHELNKICKEIENIYKGILPEWADPFLKHDKEEVLQAVSKNEQALRFASPELKADKEFIMEIISEHGNALHYVPELNEDPELLWIASKHGYVPNADERRLIQHYKKTRKRHLGPLAHATNGKLSGLNKHGYHHKNKFASLISAFAGHPRGGTKRKTKRRL